MKKLRISSLILAIVMVVSMLPVVALSVFAEGEESNTFPELPETLPGAGIRKWDWFAPDDGTIPDGSALPFSQYNAKYTTQMLVDFTQLNSDQVTTGDPVNPAVIVPDRGVQSPLNTVVSLTDGLPEENAHMWRGASGLLIAVDTTLGNGIGNDVVGSGAGWHLQLEVEMERISLDDEVPIVDVVSFCSAVRGKHPWQTYYYTYVPEDISFQCVAGGGHDGTNFSSFAADTWNCEISIETNARIVDNFQGYIYLPFDCSFFCHGAGNDGTYEHRDIMTFSDAAEIYDDIRITNLGINNAWSAFGACFRNIQLVFAEPVYNLSENTVIEEIEGEATIANPDTPVTVDTPISLKGADGIRFHVDTSAVNAPVQLRLNLISEIKKNESKWAEGVILTDYAVKEDVELDPETGLPLSNEGIYHLVIGEGEESKCVYPFQAGDPEMTPIYGMNQFVSLTSDELIQTISRGFDCLMFYYDADGTPIPLTATSETDIFAALPAGYVGEVYIPATSFYASITETLQIPLKSAEILDFSSLVFEYESEGAGNVVISDLELCMTNAYIDGASVTLSNVIDLNVYAVADKAYGNFSMDFYKDGEFVKTTLGVLVDEDRSLYKFTLTDISLLDMTATYETILKLNGEITDIRLEDYSVAKYVAHVLELDNVAAEVKTALVDLLFLGDAMMNYAEANAPEEEPEEDEDAAEGEDADEEEEEELPPALPTSFLTDAQKALRSANKAASETGEAVFEGEFDELNMFTGAEVDFACGVLSFDIKAFLDDEIGTVAVLTIKGEEYSVDAAAWGVRDGFWIIRTYALSFADLATPIVATLSYAEDQIGQTYTTSAMIALARMTKLASTTAEEKECAHCLYNLGVSFVAAVEAMAS